MPAMSRQTWTLIIDGSRLVLVDNNNNNDNNNNVSDSSNIAFNNTGMNPSANSEEEEKMIVEPSKNSWELGTSSSSSTDGDSVSLPVIDFSDLVTIPELPDEKEEEEKGDEIITPTVSFRMLDTVSFVSSTGQAIVPCSPRATDWFCADPDLNRVLSSPLNASSPNPFLTAASPDLLLLSPTTNTTACSSFYTTTTPDVRTSLSCDTSSSSSTFSPSSFSTTGPCAVTLPEPSTSPAHLRIASSPRTFSSSQSSCDDFSSSCSNVSASPSGFDDDITSFSDVITQCVVSGLAMSGGVSMSTGIEALTSSGRGGITSDTSPNDVFSTLPATDNLTSFSADVITTAALMTSSRNEVSNPEASATSTSELGTRIKGKGAQSLPKKTAAVVAAENKMADADNKMAAATLEALATCSLTPLIKEELRYTIQSRRLAAGKPEMLATEYACSGGSGRRSARHKRAMTAEERERHAKRQEQNRTAAQRFRQRQNDTEEILSKKCRKLEGANSSLQAEILRLARETQELQQLMDSHLPHCRRKVPSAKVTQ